MKSILVFILCFITISCVTDNVRKAWKYLTSHGLTKAGAAGLLGNLQAESGVRPNVYEHSKKKKIGLSDADYVKKTNNGSYKNFVHDKAGFGIAQWTFYSRKQNLLNHCKGKIGDLECQLSYLLKELKGYKEYKKKVNYSPFIWGGIIFVCILIIFNILLLLLIVSDFSSFTTSYLLSKNILFFVLNIFFIDISCSKILI